MNEYELAFILKEEKEEILNKLIQDIEGQKGTITKKSAWGKKEFYYPINKISHGFYFLWNISLPKPAVAPLKKQLNFNENVMRYLLLKIK